MPGKISIAFLPYSMRQSQTKPELPGMCSLTSQLALESPWAFPFKAIMSEVAMFSHHLRGSGDPKACLHNCMTGHLPSL